ncbi:N-acetyllactosaminide beta-1,3-N-acetylglucosaminyltransferase 2 [Etheostoma spectabile]|uniref:N-acetyllactosaminide beta-1,3-N-acetylglucosaminyltransferase 2 n=1 Tax=Etheostoma spectabile TaxID=54343 RepID=UPI0013AF25A7|nr:N-acetyllactosaminide beta-1,3-N-acetylglucosaminyltransferase 2-like [Etheostoma spectabile]
MARCYCHWRRVLFFVCTPCISLALLFVYITAMLFAAMNETSTSGTAVRGLDAVYFVASGSSSKTFWDLHLHGDAFWNRLQRTLDNHFNPILCPNNTKRGFENGTFNESLLTQGFSKVINLESTSRNLDQLPQQIQEFITHMQRRDYPALLQPDGVCGAGRKEEKEAPLLLLAIKSTEQNFLNRQAIRQTWGQAGWVAGPKRKGNGGEGGGYVRRVFLLGRGSTEELGGNALQMESEQYGDILQWDFKDTFFNLTLKDVLFWSWFKDSCSRTRFVFKGDDDVFVNTPKLMSYLRDQLKKPHKTLRDFMVGDVIAAAVPNRFNESKYFIPDSFYKGLYPMYAGGGGVVYSGLLAKRLHDISKRLYLFPIDDVYVGMCMVRLNAHPVHHDAFLTFDFPNKEEEELCSYHTILLVHKRRPDEVVKLWVHVKKTQAQCWGVALRVPLSNDTATV